MDTTNFRHTHPLSLPDAYDDALNEMHVCATIIADSCTDPRWSGATEYQLHAYTAAHAAYVAIRDLWLGI